MARQGPRASSDKNRHRAPRLENNQVQKGRDLGMTQTKSRKWTEAGEEKEELSKRLILYTCYSATQLLYHFEV